MPHCRFAPPYVFVLLVGLYGLFAAPCSLAQFSESFEDGEFLYDPAWTGDTDRWTIGELHGPALQSNGTAAADTIHLATHSRTAYGVWNFTAAHRSVNLSSFNGMRIFLVSDRPDPRRHAVGYYLQLGTNNTDAVSLWRADGSLATQRVELGRSSERVVAGDSSLLGIVVERDVFGRFRVFIDDVLVISATDNRHASSAFFAVWVKHTARGATSFLFDDIVVVQETNENAGPVPGRGEIVLNELLFDPSPGQSEFVELQNRGRTPFDLRLLRIRDARSDDIPISFSRYLLQPEAYIVLVEDTASFSPVVNGVTYLSVDGWPPLNNGGDAVVLAGPDGVVDSLSYDGTRSAQGVSLERIDPDAPSESYNFAASVDASGSTPGRVNSVFEIDNVAPSILFAEQTGAATLELHFDEPVRAYELTPSSVLYASEVVELLPLSEAAIRILLDEPPANPVIGLETLLDRKGNRADRPTSPISFLPKSGDLVFSEIMYEPRADGFDGRADQIEFVEMANISDHVLSVTHLIRTRNVNEYGNADTLRFGRPFSALVPGAYLVVAVSDSAALRRAFPTTRVGARTMYVSAPGLTLANGGDRLRIHNRLGEVIDDVTYRPQWHHPDLAERRGFSLERVDLRAPVGDAASWSSSAAADGATPGAPNSIAHTARVADASYGITVDPSPFSPDGDGHDDAAVVSYRLRSRTPNIRVRIYDVDGFEVRTLVPSGLSSADGRLVWDGLDGFDRSLRAGIYIIILEAVDAHTRRVEHYKHPVVLARQFR